MSAAAFQLTRVAKDYAGVPALRGVDLTVLPGEIHALVGLNGAGKSTLMRVLLGMTRPTSGEARVRGKAVPAMHPKDWYGVGHLVDSPLAYPELTVAENLCIAGRLTGLSGHAARDAARGIAEELALTPSWGKRARTLSQGNRQRLGIGGALVGEPTVLVLDEPTNGLDPAGVVLVRGAVLDRVRDRGVSVLVSSHHLDEVARIADRISVINGGRTIGTLDPAGNDIERGFFKLVYADVEVT